MGFAPGIGTKDFDQVVSSDGCGNTDVVTLMAEFCMNANGGFARPLTL
jgi:hypothetical protein